MASKRGAISSDSPQRSASLSQRVLGALSSSFSWAAPTSTKAVAQTGTSGAGVRASQGSSVSMDSNAEESAAELILLAVLAKLPLDSKFCSESRLPTTPAGKRAPAVTNMRELFEWCCMASTPPHESRRTSWGGPGWSWPPEPNETDGGFAGSRTAARDALDSDDDMGMGDGMGFHATGTSLLRAAGEARRLLIDASMAKGRGRGMGGAAHGGAGAAAGARVELPPAARAPCWLIRRGCARLARTMSGQATRLAGDGTSEEAAAAEAALLAGVEISWLAFNGVLGPRLQRRSQEARKVQRMAAQAFADREPTPPGPSPVPPSGQEDSGEGTGVEKEMGVRAHGSSEANNSTGKGEDQQRDQATAKAQRNSTARAGSATVVPPGSKGPTVQATSDSAGASGRAGGSLDAPAEHQPGNLSAAQASDSSELGAAGLHTSSSSSVAASQPLGSGSADAVGPTPGSLSTEAMEEVDGSDIVDRLDGWVGRGHQTEAAPSASLETNRDDVASPHQPQSTLPKPGGVGTGGELQQQAQEQGAGSTQAECAEASGADGSMHRGPRNLGIELNSAAARQPTGARGDSLADKQLDSLADKQREALRPSESRAAQRSVPPTSSPSAGPGLIEDAGHPDDDSVSDSDSIGGGDVAPGQRQGTASTHGEAGVQPRASRAPGREPGVGPDTDSEAKDVATVVARVLVAQREAAAGTTADRQGVFTPEQAVDAVLALGGLATASARGVLPVLRSLALGVERATARAEKAAADRAAAEEQARSVDRQLRASMQAQERMRSANESLRRRLQQGDAAQKALSEAVDRAAAAEEALAQSQAREAALKAQADAAAGTGRAAAEAELKSEVDNLREQLQRERRARAEAEVQARAAREQLQVGQQRERQAGGGADEDALAAARSRARAAIAEAGTAAAQAASANLGRQEAERAAAEARQRLQAKERELKETRGLAEKQERRAESERQVLADQVQRLRACVLRATEGLGDLRLANAQMRQDVVAAFGGAAGSTSGGTATQRPGLSLLESIAFEAAARAAAAGSLPPRELPLWLAHAQQAGDVAPDHSRLRRQSSGSADGPTHSSSSPSPPAPDQLGSGASRPGEGPAASASHAWVPRFSPQQAPRTFRAHASTEGTGAREDQAIDNGPGGGQDTVQSSGLRLYLRVVQRGSAQATPSTIANGTGQSLCTVVPALESAALDVGEESGEEPRCVARLCLMQQHSQDVSSHSSDPALESVGSSGHSKSIASRAPQTPAATRGTASSRVPERVLVPITAPLLPADGTSYDPPAPGAQSSASIIDNALSATLHRKHGLSPAGSVVVLLPGAASGEDGGVSASLARAAAGEFHFAAIRRAFERLGCDERGQLPAGSAVGLSYYGWSSSSTSGSASGTDDGSNGESRDRSVGLVIDCLANASSPSLPQPLLVDSEQGHQQLPRLQTVWCSLADAATAVAEAAFSRRTSQRPQAEVEDGVLLLSLASREQQAGSDEAGASRAAAGAPSPPEGAMLRGALMVVEAGCSAAGADGMGAMGASFVGKLARAMGDSIGTGTSTSQGVPPVDWGLGRYAARPVPLDPSSAAAWAARLATSGTASVVCSLPRPMQISTVRTQEMEMVAPAGGPDESQKQSDRAVTSLASAPALPRTAQAAMRLLLEGARHGGAGGHSTSDVGQPTTESKSSGEEEQPQHAADASAAHPLLPLMAAGALALASGTAVEPLSASRVLSPAPSPSPQRRGAGSRPISRGGSRQSSRAGSRRGSVSRVLDGVHEGSRDESGLGHGGERPRGVQQHGHGEGLESGSWGGPADSSTAAAGMAVHGSRLSHGQNQPGSMPGSRRGSPGRVHGPRRRSPDRARSRSHSRRSSIGDGSRASGSIVSETGVRSLHGQIQPHPEMVRLQREREHVAMLRARREITAGQASQALARIGKQIATLRRVRAQARPHGPHEQGAEHSRQSADSVHRAGVQQAATPPVPPSRAGAQPTRDSPGTKSAGLAVDRNGVAASSRAPEPRDDMLDGDEAALRAELDVMLRGAGPSQSHAVAGSQAPAEYFHATGHRDGHGRGHTKHGGGQLDWPGHRQHPIVPAGAAGQGHAMGQQRRRAVSASRAAARRVQARKLQAAADAAAAQAAEAADVALRAHQRRARSRSRSRQRAQAQARAKEGQGAQAGSARRDVRGVRTAGEGTLDQPQMESLEGHAGARGRVPYLGQGVVPSAAGHNAAAGPQFSRLGHAYHGNVPSGQESDRSAGSGPSSAWQWQHTEPAGTDGGMPAPSSQRHRAGSRQQDAAAPAGPPAAVVAPQGAEVELLPGYSPEPALRAVASMAAEEAARRGLRPAAAVIAVREALGAVAGAGAGVGGASGPANRPMEARAFLAGLESAVPAMATSMPPASVLEGLTCGARGAGSVDRGRLWLAALGVKAGTSAVDWEDFVTALKMLLS